MPVRLRRVVLALAVLLVVAGCQAIQQLPGELAGAPIVALEMSGRHCVDGPCSARASLDASGRMVYLDGTESTIQPERVARITESIAMTDWTAVLAKPFEGECPTAFDGAELTWTIQTQGGPLVVADCTIAVDDDAEPFRLFDEEFFVTGG